MHITSGVIKYLHTGWHHSGSPAKMNNKMPSTITEDSPERQGSVERLQLSSSSEQDEVFTEYRGPTYSLNSIRLKVIHLQQIADLFGLLTKGTVAVNMQLIEGKLMEMSGELEDVQVAIAGTDENGVLF